MSKENTFKFFVPAEIVKGTDSETGKPQMKIKGIASTIDEDSDGEFLDPAGFDLSYFMKNGFINWHHQSKNQPKAIIGEPTKAKIVKEGLYVEGLLYPESQLAQDVYELAVNLEKSGSKRKLGFSIEGKVLERDELNKKYVKRAKITGLAVTPTPKNSNTMVDIMKGEYSDFDTEIKVEGVKANGGSTYIIDITKPNGDRVTVDNDYNIKVLSKSTDTSNAGMLSPESVDKDIKTQKSDRFVRLNKSNVFYELIKVTDFEKAKKIVNAINFKKMAKTDTSLDELQKALQNIGVEVSTELLKASEVNQDPGTLDELINKKSKKKKDKKSKKNKKKNKPEVDDTAEDGKKVDTAVNTDTDDDLKKSLDAKLAEVEELKKQLEGRNSEIKKGFDVNIVEDVFEKGFSKITESLNTFTKSIEKRLETLENQPTGRKSMATSKIIEKSFGGPNDENNKNKTTLSISRNKRQISDILLNKSGIEKGEENEFYTKAMLDFEASNTLSKAVISDLYTDLNILITQ